MVVVSMKNFMTYYYNLVHIFYIWNIICNQMISVDGKFRNKRFLIFPRQAPTRHQFIGGIGIPADLEYESLTVGYVLKAEFFLPYNATVYRENPFLPQYTDQYINGRDDSKRSELRWDIYKYIINRLDSYGYNGLECLLKAICEANAIPFDKDYNVFAELMHIFLSPSSSLDRNIPESIHFKQAEQIGRTERYCNIYHCKISLLNWISNIFHNMN